MSSVLSFYYDGSIVQAVNVRITGNTFTVADARTFTVDDVDDYLSSCTAKNCIVSCNPSLFYQDIVHLPPATVKLHHKLVRNEIFSAHPDLTSFSVLHHQIGEATLDAKIYSKIAAFSYPDSFIIGFIAKLNRFNIRVSHVYPAPYSIFRLALSTCSADFEQPRIFIASLLREKLLLVSENGQPAFVRKIPSLDNALLVEDTASINMTIDYSFQSLRMRPNEAIVINQSKLSEDLSLFVSVPVRSALPVQLNNLPPHIIQDYLAPVAAAVHFVEAPRIGDITPAEYASHTSQKRLVASATALMAILTLACAFNVIKELRVRSDVKTSIGRIRAELSGAANELATFKKLDGEVNQLKQPLEVVNKHNSLLNPATALAALNVPKTGDYTVKAVTVQNGEKELNITIEGGINASRYSDTQALFEALVSHLGKIPGYSVVSSTVDIKLKSFKIQAIFGSGEKPGR